MHIHMWIDPSSCRKKKSLRMDGRFLSRMQGSLGCFLLQEVIYVLQPYILISILQLSLVVATSKEQTKTKQCESNRMQVP